MTNLSREEMLQLGEYFRAKRLKAKLSQRQVAEKLGYRSAQFVSNWERGQATPPLKKLKLLIEMYRLDPNEVLHFLLERKKRDLELLLGTRDGRN